VTSGIGGPVAIADYDQDGFLDILLSHGKGPEGYMGETGYQLFKNQGNQNHWLEIDLQGVESNRDGIGTQIYLTSGGVTQLREQSGGMHNFAQNYKRIHFGLAENTIVEKIVVKWPNGNEQTLENIQADQIIKIKQD